MSERPPGKDWDALFYLSGVGAAECPWLWDDECQRIFPGREEDEFRAAMNRCSAYLREKRLTE